MGEETQNHENAVENLEDLMLASSDEEDAQTSTQDISTQLRDEDNAEKSRLGRKVKSLEETVGTLTKLIEEQKKMLEMLVSGQTTQPKAVEQESEEEDEEVPEIPTTREDVLKILQWYERNKERQMTEARRQYETAYSQTLLSFLNKEDPSIRDEVQKVWAEKYNLAFTNNPIYDAEKGYLLAKMEVLQRLAKVKSSPQQPTVSSSSSTPSSPLNLSKEALELARNLGMSDDDIRKAFESTTVVGKQGVVSRKK